MAVSEHIRVGENTKRRLDELGSKGDTYDDIVSRLIDEAGGTVERGSDWNNMEPSDA